MTRQADREAERVRAAYQRRAERGLDDRYAYWQRENVFVYQSRERAVLRALRDAGMLPLAGRQVLDAGCGDGSVLQDLLRYGAEPAGLHGIDLLGDRIERARERLPGAEIMTGDLQALRYEDDAFDLALVFTVLSSVVDAAARGRIVSELRRVTRPGGLLLVYDFWLNPFNRDTRALRRKDLRDLFPDCRIDFQSLTLAPPLLRFVMKAPGGWVACSALEVIPFLKSHYLAAVHL